MILTAHTKPESSDIYKTYYSVNKKNHDLRYVCDDGETARWLGTEYQS